MSATLDIVAEPTIASRHKLAAVHRLKTEGIEKQIDAFKLEGNLNHTWPVKTGHLEVKT